MRKIETEIQEKWYSSDAYHAAPKQGYEKMSWEDKNAEKFMMTFPYPYMNGYMHLGKLLLVVNNLNSYRSRILTIKVRVLGKIPALTRKECALPILFPLHRYAHSGSSYQTEERNHDRKDSKKLPL